MNLIPSALLIYTTVCEALVVYLTTVHVLFKVQTKKTLLLHISLIFTYLFKEATIYY